METINRLEAKLKMYRRILKYHERNPGASGKQIKEALNLVISRQRVLQILKEYGNGS